MNSKFLTLLGMTAIAVVVTTLLARFPIQLLFMLAYFAITLQTMFVIRRIRLGERLSFSLLTMLLVTGAVISLCVYWRERAPWHFGHQLPGRFASVCLSGDGRLIAGINDTNRQKPLEVYDTESGRHLASVKQLSNPVRATPVQVADLAFSTDNRTILFVSPGLAGTAQEIDWKSGQVVKNWKGARIGRMSANGQRFFLYDGFDSVPGSAVCVYDRNAQEPLIRVSQPAFRGHQLQDTISQTGKHILFGGQGKSLQLWNVDENQKVGTIPHQSFSPALHPYTYASFSPNDEYLALATSAGIDIWDIVRFKRIGRWEPDDFSKLGSFEWSPNSNRLFAMYIEKTGPTTGVEHSALLDPTGRQIARTVGNGATFSPTGDRIAARYGAVTILDAQSGETLCRLSQPPNGGQASIPLPGYRAIYFSPDGKKLLHNGGASVWHRHHSEHWTGVFVLPSFWLSDFFLVVLSTRLFRHLHRNRQPSSPNSV